MRIGLQMQKAMSEAASRLITRLLFAPSLDVTEDQFLLLHVTRENIVQNTIDQLTMYSSTDLKKPLRVSRWLDVGRIARECR